jgi:putative pyruvate formate lyase activating enzyme
MATKPPLYLQTIRAGRMDEKIRRAMAMLRECNICPRQCRVNRTADEQGTCQTGRLAIVSSYGAHHGEEAPISGRNGSGTIFFTGCNLLCRFCQNFDISHQGAGEPINAPDLADIMLSLQAQGCHNINLVTPTHVVPQILKALALAADRGLEIPLVYNSGGYERVETLTILEGVVDIYMPDFKFWDSSVANKLCNAPDYPRRACNALREMHRQVGDLVIDNESGIARRGLLLRHLVMPGEKAGTAQVMQFVAKEISTGTYVNVMGQYRPCGDAPNMPGIDRAVSAQAVKAARRATREAGLSRLDAPRRVFWVT